MPARLFVTIAKKNCFNIDYNASALQNILKTENRELVKTTD
jgi:hypothetical protein